MPKATAPGRVRKMTQDPLRVAYCPLCEQSWAVGITEDPSDAEAAARDHAAAATHGPPLFIGELTL